MPSSGAISWTDLQPRTTTALQVRSVDTGLTSRVAGVSVRSTVSVATRRTSTRTWTFTGAVRPTRPGQPVILYEVGRGGSLTRLGSARTDGRGVYSLRVAFRTTGARTFVTRTSTDEVNVAGQSAATGYRIT